MDAGRIDNFVRVDGTDRLTTARVVEANSSTAPLQFSRRVSRSQSGLPYTWVGDAPCGRVVDLHFQINMIAKRITDVTLATLALISLMPMLALVAIAIKIDSPGPVFFRQQREGLEGRVFSIFKFRSMSVHLEDTTGISQTTSNDARVTRVGRFLRRTSIDELPQLFNIITGDMSLVGPRPHVPGMIAGGTLYSELVPYYRLRHAMPPGLTGWAQANGLRGETRDPRIAQMRIDHDIAYIQNFSWWLDIRCLFMTLKREFITGSGI